MRYMFEELLITLFKQIQCSANVLRPQRNKTFAEAAVHSWNLNETNDQLPFLFLL